MILHTGIDGTGPVDLFGQHQAGQLMGHGDAAHTESEGCGFLHFIGQAVGGADDERHIPCPAVCAVGQELRQLIGGDLPALNAHGNDGSTLAHVGQDGLALLVQCLFYHGIRGVLLLDLFLRQLDDAEGREGGKALLVLGHALGEIFCIQLAHTDQVDVLHCSFLFYIETI